MEGIAARGTAEGSSVLGTVGLAARACRALALGATGVALIAATGCGGDGDGSQAAGGPPEPVTTKDPARTFAPLVHLHSKERLFPIAADDFIAASKLKWATDGCPDEAVATSPERRANGMDKEVPVFMPAQLARPSFRNAPLQDDCWHRRQVSFTNTQHTRPYDVARPPGLPLGDGFYLDALTERLRGAHRVERDDSTTSLAATVPVYVDSRPEQIGGASGMRLTYWLLFAYQELPLPYEISSLLEHEGDWERVSVLLRRLTEDGRYLPVSATYDIHGRRRELAWSSVERTSAADGDPATHPVVYAARGSHTPYPSAGDRATRLRPDGEPLAVREQAESCDECPQWRTWKRVLPVREQPWYGFGGGWGLAYERGASSGPLGPSRFAR